MHEPQVGVNALVAWILWAVATIEVLSGTIALALNHHDLALALYAFAMLAIGASVSATLRCYLDQNRRALAEIRDRLELEGDVRSRLFRT